MGTTYNGFGLLLYPDNPVHEKAREMIIRLAPLWGWKWFMIKHDRDALDGSETDEEDMAASDTAPNLKKAHWHAVIISGDKKSPGTIAIQLGIEKRFVQGLNSIRGMLRYLVHVDYPEKYQYDSSEVMTNDNYSTYLDTLSIGRTFDDQLGELYQLLFEMRARGEKLTYTSVIMESRNRGLAKFVMDKHQQASKMIDDFNAM